MLISQGTEETVRVVSMDKDFHVDCYVCEVRICLKKFLFNKLITKEVCS